MTSSDRFFATAISAAKCICGTSQIRDRGIPSGLNGTQRAEIDPGLVPAAGDRKIRTPTELEAIMRAPTGLSLTRLIWIHESLVDEVRQLWNLMAAELG